MPMQNNLDRLELRMQARDLLLKAGSPMMPSQIANELETNNHMANRIISEFEDNNLISPLIIGKNTENPLIAWEATKHLNQISKEKMGELIEIKKPREIKIK